MPNLKRIQKFQVINTYKMTKNIIIFQIFLNIYFFFQFFVKIRIYQYIQRKHRKSQQITGLIFYKNKTINIKRNNK